MSRTKRYRNRYRNRYNGSRKRILGTRRPFKTRQRGG